MEYRRIVQELHAPARRQYPRRRTIIKGYNDLFQADLVEMQPYAKENKGYRYILMVIDTYSKYVGSTIKIERCEGSGASF